jgi:hypothetical protein
MLLPVIATHPRHPAQRAAYEDAACEVDDDRHIDIDAQAPV